MKVSPIGTSPIPYQGVAVLNATFGPLFPNALCTWFVCSISNGHTKSVSRVWLLLMWLTNISLK